MIIKYAFALTEPSGIWSKYKKPISLTAYI